MEIHIFNILQLFKKQRIQSMSITIWPENSRKPFFFFESVINNEKYMPNIFDVKGSN